ncbi:hypothetical protein [Ralstonia pseudosolanacearum]|uniref:Uncharacterized protein n=1 Tax=Ralstonia solanacearum TaxID=305 RepID=A0AA92ECK8_RALSL|nr:hypothetical protein [Ralstonia pseudosolanacearum]QCX49358.1 hypothetical protein E7Z57_09720 [Ralstonia pseudosolanacearum]
MTGAIPRQFVYFEPLWLRWPSMPANTHQARIRNQLIAFVITPQSLVLQGFANKSPPPITFNAKFIAITRNASAGAGSGLFCTRFDTCVMCVALQEGISMTDHDEQLRNSAAVPAGQPHGELHSSTAEWLRRAMAGIKQMHENEDVRQEVAKRIF